jgi:xanthosine utilization system XapX-like protein
MSGIILTFCVGVIVGLVFALIKEEMAARKILRMEYAGLLRLAAG